MPDWLLLKKKFFIVMMFMLTLIIGLYGCDSETEESFSDKNTKDNYKGSTGVYNSSDTWAFYWYLCGSDLESEWGFASTDLEEMLEATLSENITIVIETGGASEWQSDVSADSNSRYIYDSEGFSLIEEIPVSNMGSADTLENFLRFCNENYPADHQSVVFWNHGGGSVSGVAFDELYDFDSLTLPEMRTAFEEAGTASGEKYEMIGFDTCLMATIDVVDIVGDFANYLVASEESEPGGGWDYEAFFQAISDDPSMDGAQLGKEICDSYYEACENDGTDDMITLSVIDLSQSERLVQAYNDIGIEALASAGINPSYITSFSRAARSAENYGGNNNSEGYTNMVDLGDLVRQSKEELLPSTGDELLSALESAVVYQVKGPLRSNASGLSCYYSYDGDYDDYVGFADLDTSPAFQYYFDYMLSGEISDELVEYMASTYTDEEIVPEVIEMPEIDDLEDFPVEVTEDSVAVMNLGADIVEKLVGVYVNLAYVDEEEGIAILLGIDNGLEADWENGIFKDNFRGVWGSLDGNLVYMELSDETDTYQVYAVPVLLNGDEYTMLVSYIYSTEKFKILGLRIGIDDNGMADKNIRALMPGDVVEPLHYVVDLEGDNDEISQIAVDKIVVTIETEFYEADMGDGEFIFMFEMRDIQNNSYLSETVAITVEDGEIYLSE